MMRKYISMFLLVVLGGIIGSILNNYYLMNMDTNSVDHQQDRFWSIYSNHYFVDTLLSDGDTHIYSICSSDKEDVCIELIQYSGSIAEYMNTIVDPMDRMPIPYTGSIGMVDARIDGRLRWKCTRVYESDVCFHENSQGLLIMKIDDQMGIGFHGGEGYNARDLLEVIGY